MKLTAKERRVVLDALDAYRVQQRTNVFAFKKANLHDYAAQTERVIVEIGSAHQKISAEKAEKPALKD